MAARKFGSAVVVDEDGRVIGIFTTTDALDALARVLDAADAEGSRKRWKIEDILRGNYLWAP
jgi:CBS domain-containing protein